MPKSPRSQILALLLPVVICIGCLMLAGTRQNWRQLLSIGAASAIYLPAAYRLLQGKPVILPGYYVTVGSSATVNCKRLAIAYHG